MKTKQITSVILSRLLILLMMLAFGLSLEAAPQQLAPSLVQAEAPLAEDALVGMRVTALITVCNLGTVESVEIRDAEAPGFAASVKATVKQWRFTPAVRNGQAVSSCVLVPFVVVPTHALLAMR
jgi:TonB family protein